ncbi:N-acetylmuramoyl-L-alanine amidase [Paracoccus hibiscisoli]|uniref:N-acetylmuramoyl-L-alanine amidase n=1 Tax=Paracoccus hibiscisoli TaxID=2023261 RepID=UPI0023F1058E|nr:N-acetylmuramoyl-L-alanine amidase [Paracoccus hibiscisoli]
MSNSPIRRIVIHYSATYPDQDFGVADIDKMHRARGFTGGVGYHYVIKRDGTIQKGRPDATVGAHVSGHNTGSLGICCIGGIERSTGPNVGVDNRTEAQKAATVKLVRELLQKHPGAEVLGHRDLGATQCPGFDVRSWWAAANARPPVVDAVPPIARPAAPNPLAALFAWLSRIFRRKVT